MIAGIFNIRRPIKASHSPSPLAPPQIVWVNWEINYGPRVSGSSYDGITDVVVAGDKLITMGPTGDTSVGALAYTTDLTNWTLVAPNEVASGDPLNFNHIKNVVAFHGTTLMVQDDLRRILYTNVANIDTGWQIHLDDPETSRPSVVFDRLVGSNGYWVGFERFTTGLFVSTNVGGSWTSVSSIDWIPQSIAVMANGDFIIVGLNNKIATSMDGVTWTDRSIPSASNGGSDSTIQFSDVTVCSADGHIYANSKAYNNGDINDPGGEGIGIWRSVDNGVTWEQAAWLDPTPFTGIEFGGTSGIIASDKSGHLLALSPAGEPIMTADGFANYEVKYYTDDQDLPNQSSGYRHRMAFIRISGEPYWFIEGALSGTNIKQVYTLNNEAPYGNVP